MNEPNDVPFTQWATINATEKFIAFTPLSGYRRSLPENEPNVIYLEPEALDVTLGEAFLEALNRSRFLDPHTDRDFFEADRILAADKRWHADFMKRYRYKTMRDAYKNMRYCKARKRDGQISIWPHKRNARPRYWWDLAPEKTVIIPETNDPVILGAAARLALSRCE